MTKTTQYLTRDVTPYAFAEVFSDAMGQDVRPQQIYGYVRSGALETGIFDSGHKKVTVEAGNAFIESRLALREEREAKKAEAEAEANAEETVS